jgi:exodeoxyribonuclease VII large subunit
LHLEPVGVGNLQAAFEQLKTKLRDKGLFDAKHKKPLPTKVDTIGVISSSNGAVIRDIIKVLNKRYPFAEILLFDCVVRLQAQDDEQSVENHHAPHIMLVQHGAKSPYRFLG